MNKIIKIALGVFILTGAIAEVAVANPYIGTSVFTLDTDVGDFRGVDLNVGYRVDDVLEFRVHYMIGAEDETYQGVSIEIDQMYGADVIVNIPLSDSLNPYLIMGNTWIKAKASYMGYSDTAKDDYMTYGVGMRFDVREAVSIYGEYKTIDGDGMFGFGLTANF